MPPGRLTWATFCGSVASSRVLCVSAVVGVLLSASASSSPAATSSGAWSDERVPGGSVVVLRVAGGSAGVPEGLEAGAAGPRARAVGSAWLSAMSGECPEEPCDTPSVEPSSPPSSPEPSSEPSATPSSEASCDSLRGTYPYPDPPPSGQPLPEWVSSSDGLRCVVVVSTLDQPTTEVPPEPTGDGPLLAELQSVRQLILFSGGLVVFLLGAMLLRGRWA